VRREILSLALPALLLAGAGHAAAGGFDVRAGGFFPRARSCGVPSSVATDYTLFQDVCELYVPHDTSLDDFNWKKKFNGIYGGVEYNTVLAPMVELGIGVDAYGRSVDTSYRDYTRPDESEIRQRLKLRIVPLGVTVRFLPTMKGARIAPYVGAGVDALFYSYEETGDFIDFGDPGLAIVPDTFKDNGTAFGAHGVVGLRLYLSRDFAIVGEGRYQWAKAKEMGHDFAPNAPNLVNRIDLSGYSATIGLHVRF
jgi:outer membrane protein W